MQVGLLFWPFSPDLVRRMATAAVEALLRRWLADRLAAPAQEWSAASA